MNMTIEEFRAQILGKAKPSKYRNVPVMIDGIRFASKLEGQFYGNLKLREKAGEVHGVELQKRYPIIGPDGLLITTYVADFVYWDQILKRMCIIDVKGMPPTPAFNIKKKLMKSLLGINVEVVRK
jgi:hypothetical protein